MTLLDRRCIDSMARPVVQLENPFHDHLGERARYLATEQGQVFEVSKVRLSVDGHVRDVLWGEVNTASGHDGGPKVEVYAADVVDAIHDGAVVVALFEAPEPNPRKRAFVVQLREMCWEACGN